MPKLHYIKLAAQFVVGASVSKVIKDVIICNTDPETPIEQIEITIGSATLGWMVSDMAKDWTDAKIDYAAELVANMKDELNCR
jgi:hypothetical protein